jgi:hypothetical protein
VTRELSSSAWQLIRHRWSSGVCCLMIKTPGSASAYPRLHKMKRQRTILTGVRNAQCGHKAVDPFCVRVRRKMGPACVQPSFVLLRRSRQWLPLQKRAGSCVAVHIRHYGLCKRRGAAEAVAEANLQPSRSTDVRIKKTRQYFAVAGQCLTRIQVRYGTAGLLTPKNPCLRRRRVGHEACRRLRAARCAAS